MRFERCHWISVGPTWLVPRWFNGSAQISLLWPSYFFYTALFLVTDPNFHSPSTLSSDNSHSISKSQVICQKAKKRRFWHFLVILCKKNWSGRQSDNIEGWWLAHSSFQSWCSTFFKTHVEVSDTFKNLGPSPVWSWMIQNCDTQKNCF